MLNKLDDYPIHQTPEPIAHPATGDRNAYDRYWFNGFTPDGSVFFALAFGLYPNRRVMDAAFSVVRGGVQYSVHASRLAPLERTETAVAPIAVEVLEPMRKLRVRVEPNEHALEADLVFRARAEAIEEPRITRRAEGRVVMDSTRFTQFGTWEGSLRVAGESLDLSATRTLATRDRSWGIRGVGERERAAPGAGPQFFWLWAPLHFEEFCTHFQVNEDAEGRRWHQSGVITPLLDAPGPALERMASVHHEVDWEKGTRWARSARLTLVPLRGEPRVLELTPIVTFQMRGIGYGDPEWGHGVWKGEHEVGGASWKLDEVDPLAPSNLHIQQLCRARLGDHEGLGAFEQLVIGPHAPSRLTQVLDGAS
jgi:hypothetical protein